MASSSPKTFDNNVLIIPIAQFLRHYDHLEPLIEIAAQHTNQRLLIFLVSPTLFNEGYGGAGDAATISPWKEMEVLLSFVYITASRTAVSLDRVLMQIDVVLHSGNNQVLSGVEREKIGKWNLLFTPRQVEFDLLPNWLSGIPRRTVDVDIHSPGPEVLSSPTVDSSSAGTRKGVVALGGTFDHLHAGHKILLSMSAWITSRKLIVGVTDDALLRNKSNKDVLESLDQRMNAVRDFLQLFRPQIEHFVLPISDVYGPTATDPDIDALVVSKETMSGGNAIGKLRGERGLPALETFVINVISGDAEKRDLAGEDDTEKLKAAKMSSTYIREWIVQRRRRNNE